jgi:hypothetical protein
VIHRFIGRLWLEFIKRRYGRRIRIAAVAGVVLTALGVAAYLASRGGEEQDLPSQ